MSLSLRRLLPLIEREREAGRAMVLATVVHTAGPTYTKAGTLMVIAASGEYAGLLSGGCLEGDLAEHGRAVLSDGSAKLVRYDMRGPDDLLFGLGSGCEGAMDILLQRLDASNGWQPMTRLAAAWQARRGENLLLVVHSQSSALPPGSGVFLSDLEPFGVTVPSRAVCIGESLPEAGGTWADLLDQAKHLRRTASSRFMSRALPGTDLLALIQPAPTRILLLGAGPDAQPVAELAVFLGWSVLVVDHREHYAQRARFPDCEAVLNGGPAELANLLQSAAVSGEYFSAAIVMSHHLSTDCNYLRVLAASDIPYIGLLGPAARRERLLSELAGAAERLRPRLRAPIGLDLGATTPESIALAVVAEIHASLSGRAHVGSLSTEADLQTTENFGSKNDLS
jgi:xanthine/CO dehydrogenase XdhC/CoxF family maturation factor